MSLLYRAKHAKKPKLHIPLGAWLLYLIVATVVLTGVSFSKFATSEQNRGNANIAVVVLDGGGDDDIALLIDESTPEDDYAFYVTNNADGRASDVAMEYTLSVELPSGVTLPAGVKMMLEYSDEGQWVTSEPITPAPENGVYTYIGGDNFAAGVEQQHNYRLSFEFIDIASITEDITFADISISVKAEQLA